MCRWKFKDKTEERGNVKQDKTPERSYLFIEAHFKGLRRRQRQGAITFRIRRY